MTKLKISLCSGLAFGVIFSNAGQAKIEKPMSIFFPQLTVSASADYEKPQDNITVIEEDEEIEYSFKIAEIFHSIFG